MAIDSTRLRPGIYLLNNHSDFTYKYIVDNETFSLHNDESVVVKVKDTLRYDTTGDRIKVSRIGNNDNVITAGYNPN